MIRFEACETYGWGAAVRGMRNPKNSWEKSDSYPAVDCKKCGKIEREGSCTFQSRTCIITHEYDYYEIGPNDYKLMTTLRNAGTDHRKFMRMIVVSLDITAPLYWWKEYDTYKVGTVANSCSTMHKIAAKPFEIADFSHEHLVGKSMAALKIVLDALNHERDCYLATKDKDCWWQMIQLLPSSYNQRRTVMLNYEVLANIYKSRRNHKLDEWHAFCDWIETLPYSWLITGKEACGDE